MSYKPKAPVGQFEQNGEKEAIAGESFSESSTLNEIVRATESYLKSSPFTDISKFQDYQRMAKMLQAADSIPKRFKDNIGDCVIAMEIAERFKTSPLMVMQSLYVVHGNPGWTAQWVIAQLNNCGRFTPVEYEMSDLDETPINVEYTEYEWDSSAKRNRSTKRNIDVYNRTCRAIVYDKRTGKKLSGPEVSIKMAVQEGWYTKSGSKWQTMQELMLMYRSASFLGKLYAPDLLMGLPSVEELHDITEQDKQDTHSRAEPDTSTEMEALRAAAEAQREKIAEQAKKAKQTEELKQAAKDNSDTKPKASAQKQKPVDNTQETAPVQGELTNEQPKFSYAQIAEMIKKSKNSDDVDTALSLTTGMNPNHIKELSMLASSKKNTFAN